MNLIVPCSTLKQTIINFQLIYKNYFNPQLAIGNYSFVEFSTYFNSIAKRKM